MLKVWTHAKLCRVWFGKFESEHFGHLKNYAEHAMSSSRPKNLSARKNYAEHALQSSRAKKLRTRKTMQSMLCQVCEQKIWARAKTMQSILCLFSQRKNWASAIVWRGPSGKFECEKFQHAQNRFYYAWNLFETQCQKHAALRSNVGAHWFPYFCNEQLTKTEDSDEALYNHRTRTMNFP